MNANTNVLAPAAVTARLSDLDAKIDTRDEAVAELAALEAQVAKEAKWLEANAGFIPGSGHAPTTADREAFVKRGATHIDPVVYLVKCVDCGEVTARNGSDVFHCPRCPKCGKTAAKARGKVKRAAARLAKVGGSLETLDAETEALKAKIAALKAR